MSLWMMIYGSLGPVGIITYGGLAEAIDIQTVFILAAGVMAGFLAFMTARRGFRVLDAPAEAAAR